MHNNVGRPLVISAILICSASSTVRAVEFNHDIRPIFSEHCFACHGPDATHREAGLRFDLEGDARQFQSEILRRVSSDDQAQQMPPPSSGKAKLNAKEIEHLKTWFREGAAWEPFWSFIPPKRPTPPAVKEAAWTRNPIDNFILARLEREGLRPSPEAGKRLLIRRVSLDLTGLPPAPSDVRAFVEDESPNAYEKVVDRLLASPRYGEQMAFRWMEAARYGDSNGSQTDGARDMWRWRDWAIQAFNRNMRYDEFTIEQLAGDLLPDATLDQRIATGFNRNHRTTGEGGTIPEEYRVEYVVDRAQTTGAVWLGLTVGCARCHDHKYDPISQKDFYRLFAYFNQVPNEQGFVWNWGPEEPFVKAPLPEQQKKLAALDQQIVANRQTWADLQPKLRKTQQRWEAKQSHSQSPDWTPTRDLVFRADGKGTFNGDAAEFGYMQPFTFAAWIKPAVR